MPPGTDILIDQLDLDATVFRVAVLRKRYLHPRQGTPSLLHFPQLQRHLTADLQEAHFPIGHFRDPEHIAQLSAQFLLAHQAPVA
jgi:hypothetical protein